VFFVVFFNVYQGVKEASTTLLDNARMLGMSERQLLRHVYWPSALSWMFHRCILRSGLPWSAPWSANIWVRRQGSVI